MDRILAVFMGVLVCFLTLLRENIFLEINAIIDGYDYNRAYFYFLNSEIKNLSLTQLFLLKWGLTIGFILLISALSLLSINWWFKNKAYNRITLFVYFVFFAVTIVLTAFLWLTNNYANYYFVIRRLIGFLQSPLPLFLFVSMYLYLINTSKDTEM